MMKRIVTFILLTVALQGEELQPVALTPPGSTGQRLTESAKLRYREAQLMTSEAYGQVVQTQPFQQWQGALRQMAALVQELEAQFHCKIDPQTADCSAASTNPAPRSPRAVQHGPGVKTGSQP